MVIVVWLLLALVVGLIASWTGRNFLMWFVISIVISPVGGFIFLLLSSVLSGGKTR